MFVDLPRRRKSHLRWATPLLATLMVASLIWISLLPDDAAWRATLLRWGTLSGSVTEWRAALHDGRLMTLVSALFIHLGPIHLVGNLLFLFIFGLPAERSLGPWRFLLLFLAGGALANLAAALLMGTPARAIIGASGGVSAVIGAYLALFPRARLGVVVPLGLWLEFIKVPAALLIGLWAALQLAFTFVGPSFGAVAWWAHLAGFVVGFVYALVLKPMLARKLRGG
ncbi:rhomboid family intramembrane serine protease [Arenimonas terrae]|uniref:Rhomboid family intramembrane serine protease n=1 Tax=Arenimonas terrae TaxID=2546226 RepID=A0A5C4RYM6_9GAMM|nr:rhomboid family intramembrane serine protease [Arenimonas terrae]TNJ35777.1 rhomboid family intramembrane serine protease [Arenimonas terrae]